MNVFFKNLMIYRFSRTIDINVEQLEKQLDEFRFAPCGSQDMQKFGWVPPMGKHGELLTHAAGDCIFICARKEEKLLPASVIKDAVDEKVEVHEQEQGRRLKKSEKDTIKDEVVMDLLPRAFSRNSNTAALITKEYVIVDSANFKGAENLLALLRKSIGSLPVVPVTPQKPAELTMTEWVRSNACPSGFIVGEEAELKAILQDGGIIRCKQQELDGDEISVHLEADKLVTKLALNWQDRVDFILSDDLAIKRLKFSDELKDQNEDIDREDIAQRFDADAHLFAGEIQSLINSISQALGGFDGQEETKAA